MEPHIVPATGKDVDVILSVMDAAASGMAHPEYYVTDDREFVERHIEEEGFTLLWKEKGETVGFLLVHLPGDGEENLGRDGEVPPEELCRVAHMESAAVLPRFQGNGLQKKLVAAAEELLRRRGIRYAFSTVHPENAPSLRSMRAQGYEIVQTKEKYGGKLRHILGKELK